MRKLLFAALALLAVTACELGSGSATSGSPATLARMAAQPSDFPAASKLTVCSHSGTFQKLSADFHKAGNDNNSKTTDSLIASLTQKGMTDSWEQLLTSSSAQCESYLTGQGSDAPASFVVVEMARFKDEASALEAYNKGYLTLGLFTPDELKKQPGTIVGAASGLGPNSAVNPGGGKLYFGLFESHGVVVFITVIGVDGGDKAAAAMYGRVK